MTPDRIDRYMAGNPIISQTKFASCSIREIEWHWHRLESNLCLDISQFIGRTNAIHSLASMVPNICATDKQFNLLDIVHSAKRTDEVLLVWDDWQEVDVSEFRFVCQEFDNLWFQTTDDLDIIDINGQWGILIDHNGLIAKWERT
jgi:hypothetical protein